MNKPRQFLLILPLLVIPFLTMAFWALGGGQNTRPQSPMHTGLDAALPEARFKKEKGADKMTLYQAARRDSAQNGVSPSFLKAMAPADSADRSAERIRAKLAAIDQQISQPAAARTAENPEAEASGQKIKQLQRLMRSAKSGQQRQDPEMAQLSTMLAQIQAIQNPASVKIPRKPEDNKPFQAIPAVIDGKQKVTDGGAVRLRLTDSVQLREQWIPRGQEIYGVCSVTNQRLLLTIQNIRLDKQIIPVNLTVFSLDGMPGIPAPEAELGTTAGNGASEAVQNLQLLTMDQSLGAQAAAGGLNAAKGLFSKKVKKIQVKLQDRFPVLLKINR
jgi:hypothetical protein